MMLTSLFLTVGSALSFAAESPRSVSWTDFAARTFEPRWIMPTYPEQREGDLLSQLESALSARFEPAGETGIAAATTFGELVEVLGPLRSSSDQLAGALARLERERPDVHARVGGLLAELLSDRQLRDGSWNPEKSRPDDGILPGETLKASVFRSGPWSQHKGSKSVHQAAVLIFADLEAIKTSENDYARYPRRIGADYEEIYAVRDSYVAGTGDAGGAFSGLKLAFRCDLPFPFGGYSCDLRVMNRIDTEGRLRTEIYSPSKDFYWLAGQDMYLPVCGAEGRVLGYVIVRRYGFDLRGVPDKDSHRKTALRSSLGNLKREAETRFGAEQPIADCGTAAEIPSAPLTGVR